VGFGDVSIGMKNELFFQEGLDYPNQIESAQQISVYVKSNSRLAGGRHEAIAAPDLPVGQISGPTVDVRAGAAKTVGYVEHLSSIVSCLPERSNPQLEINQTLSGSRKVGANLKLPFACRLHVSTMAKALIRFG
jgi:hypothetical protein